MSDMTLLRIGIAVAMSLLFGAIIYFGRGRRNAQGRRVPREGMGGGEDDGVGQAPCGQSRPQSLRAFGRHGPGGQG